MRIAIDCRMSGLSGIGVYLDGILSQFISLNSSDHFVLIGNLEQLARYRDNRNCTLIETDAPIFTWKEVIGFPIREINKCDVYYSPNYNIPFGINIPIFATIHDVVFLDVKNLISNLSRLIRWLVLWRTVLIARKIFTVSEFSKTRIEYHFKNTKEIVVAHSGINQEIYRFHSSGTSNYEFQYVLFIGNIKKHKGLDTLLDAFELIKRKGLLYHLVIVGDYINFKTSDTNTINRIKKNKDYITFTGKVSNNELYNIIANASLLVQPSIYEGFGLPPMEALYLGCNALISDIPVFKEIYGKLPVEFFKVNNSLDLFEKIEKGILLNPPNLNVKTTIDNLYSLERSARIIIEHIKNEVKNEG